ncbi:helix-turn-helix transcriptional regulator [Paenibacillus lycopersici]|uniref:Helix-turn-helix transcriptional regulator n=1 Tax=Paenibacillus lycopersici TaxID=2704462 RepID=A0A6C0G0V9_9BACL|nr:helix-turn-helix domain-containing protein [Paenibacillus lycopersici]QHT60849.1 helix-turn-helix transcriptional regulator [Paenibacillus lycopersici]
MEMKVETDWIELWQGSEAFSNVPHTHDEWMQVTLPVKGVCHFTQEARSFGLEQGSGLIQPPGTNHHFRIGESAAVVIVKVRERGRGGMASVRRDFEAGAGHELRQRFDADAVVARFRTWMLALIQGQSAADPLAVQEVEHDVLAYVSGLIGMEHGETYRSEPPKGVADPHLLRAIAYMHDCYDETISVDELAALALQSRFHFIRSFREATGTTPYQYVLKLRVDEAMARLRRTETTIGQISADLGFASTSQFHRAFLKMTGMTPKAYRLLQ